MTTRNVFCEPLGTELTLPERVSRIVSFSPAVTETIALLGLENSLVGTSAFCMRPESVKKIRKVGSYNTVDPKLLSDLEPEIVFAVTGYQREFALRLGKETPVYAIELPVSVSGILDMVVKIGLVLNVPDRATSLVRIGLDTLSRLEPIRRPVTVYLEIDLGGPVSFGMFSYITDALRLLGIKSIYGDRPCEWLTPDLGEVRSLDPDAIVYEPKMFKRFGSEDWTTLVEKRSWQNLKAVKEGRVFLTPGPLDFVAHHGPSFVTDVLPWLRERLDPETRAWIVAREERA